MAEMKAFVFSITFIILFSVILVTTPTDLQGLEETPDMLTPLDPSIITGFSASENFSRATMTPLGTLYYRDYNALGGRNWRVFFNTITNEWSIGAKVLYLGGLWLGQYDIVNFITSDTGLDRGDHLTFAEINADATDGVIRYNLQYVTGGTSAGGFVVYWNSTTYASSFLAWDASKLYLLHGVGIQETATADIGALLISLLLLQLPDVPLLINILLVTPVWGCIVYVLWFIIKEMIPFV